MKTKMNLTIEKNFKSTITTSLLFTMIAMSSFTSPVHAQSESGAYLHPSHMMSVEDSVASFCNNRLRILERAMEKAMSASQAQDFDYSVVVLKEGLTKALQNIPAHYRKTITAKAIERTMNLVSQIERSKADTKRTRILNYLLMESYEFIKDASNTIDIPFYSVRNAFSHITQSNVAFESAYSRLSYKQLSMVQSKMQISDHSASYPVGSMEAYLLATREALTNVTKDLMDSVFAQKNSCAILDNLDTLEEINAHLLGGSRESDFEVMQRISWKVSRALGKNACGANTSGSSNGYSGKTSQVLTQQFYVERGTMKQFRLGRGMNVKKLLISASGIGNDAMFDVVVNGDVKGTIHVPKVDPTYFVTVNEYTDSIEFVSRSGGRILIENIVVVEE